MSDASNQVLSGRRVAGGSVALAASPLERPRAGLPGSIRECTGCERQRVRKGRSLVDCCD